jgi:RNA polymerase sigma factor (sigma-70 family)
MKKDNFEGEEKMTTKTYLKRPDQDTFLSDKDYLEIIFNGETEEKKKEGKTSLFMKYFPLVSRLATEKFFLKGEDKEDFIGEAYFSFEKTLKYVDLERIDKNFSFGYFFRCQLLNQGIEQLKKRKRIPEVQPVSEETPVEEGLVLENLLGDKAVILQTLEKIPSSKIKDRDKQIFGDSLKGLTVQSLSTKYKLSEMRIRKIKKTVQTILKEYQHAWTSET